MVDGATFAQENECLFVEGSAKTGDNVEEAFSKLTQTVMYKVESGEIPEDVVSTTKKGSGQNLKDARDALGDARREGSCSYC